MWPCLQLVAEGKASWTEVTEKMSVEDVNNLTLACEVLADARAAAEEAAARKGKGS